MYCLYVGMRGIIDAFLTNVTMFHSGLSYVRRSYYLMSSVFLGMVYVWIVCIVVDMLVWDGMYG